MDKIKIIKARNNYVAMSNTLIQKGVFHLTAEEYNTVFYLISKIKPDDEPNTEYIFNVGEYIKVCGKDKHKSGTYYKYVRETLKRLRSKSVVIREATCDIVSGWINEAVINRQTGEIAITFPQRITPYLFHLQQQGRYTQFLLDDGTPIKTAHGKRLYLLLRSKLYRSRIIVYDVDMLRIDMECDKYPAFKDFKRYVIDAAVKDINLNADIYISYDVGFTGRKATQVEFHITERGAYND